MTCLQAVIALFLFEEIEIENIITTVAQAKGLWLAQTWAKATGHSRPNILAWLGLALFGLAWPGFWPEPEPTTSLIRAAVASSILNKMPSLRSLKVPPVLAPKTLPGTLEVLVFLYDYAEEGGNGAYAEHPDWFPRDVALVSALTG